MTDFCLVCSAKWAGANALLVLFLMTRLLPTKIVAAKHKKRRKLAAASAVLGAGSFMLAKIQEAAAVHGVRRHTSILTGRAWLQELLDSNNKFRLRDQLGMSRFVFLQLVTELEERAGLGPTRWMTARERVALFLYAIVTNVANRKLQERFQRSGHTISTCVYALCIL